MNQMKNRKELLSWINTVSFLAYDMALYLDTHPDDTAAMSYFQKYSQMRQQAIENYSSKYEPITMDSIGSESHWNWATKPQPWEGGYC